jgi:TonB-linked outer membrane protein, SusC/RagA family
MEKFFDLRIGWIHFLCKKQCAAIKVLIAAVVLLGFSPYVAHSQGKKISLNLKNATVKQALEEVKSRSNYSMWYSVSDIDAQKVVTVNLKGCSVYEALNAILAGQNVDIDVKDNRILITKTTPGQRSNEGSTKNGQKSKKIVGKVLDENGQPLPGATVVIKGSSIGTMSDANGQYSIEVPSTDVDLSVSFLGYKTVIVPSQFASSIKMISNSVSMDAVVVTGYQTISKERSTGSFNIVSKAALEKPATSLATRLIGTSSGLQADINSNGDATNFTIRGQSSMGSVTGTNSKPLVVVDGFPVQGSFSTINPNDVESVCILKDAASASIWGARAANGVIVVTTKNAKKGTPLSVNFSSFVKVGSNYDLDYSLNKASSAETIEFEKYAFGKWGERKIGDSPTSSNFYDYRTAAVTVMNECRLGKITTAERDAELDRLKSLDNKDQIRKYILQRPISQQYNLSISSSTARMSNNLSLLYNTSRPAFKGNYSNDYMLNYRANASLAKWVDLEVGTMLQYRENQTGGYNSGDITSLAPYEMLVNPDGSYTNIGKSYYTPLIDRYVPKNSFPYSNWGYNPIEEMNNRSIIAKNLNTRIQAGLTFKLWDGLNYSSKIQYELFNTWNKDIEGEKTFSVRSRVNTTSSWDKKTGKVVANLPSGAILSQGRDESCNYNFRNQLDFSRAFNDLHNVTLLVGTEISQSRSQGYTYPTTYGFNTETLSASPFPNGTGYPTAIYDWSGYAQTFDYSSYFSSSTTRNFSLYGNASYTYNRRYNISGSYRTDASNFITDDPKYRYSPFWSVGASWVASDEPFMKEFKWIDRLSLRATFGYNGNSTNTSSFNPLVAVSNRDVITGDLDVWITSKGNPTLRWEKTGTTNIGVDYSFFEGKLYGNIEVYNKHGKDILASVSMSSVNGSTQEQMNNAEILNQGIELVVGTSQSLGYGITWDGNFNFSYNRNEVKKLFITSYSPSDLASGHEVEGKNMSTLWVYRYGGIKNIGSSTSPNMQPVINGANGKYYTLGESIYSENGFEIMKDAGTKTAPYTIGMTNSFSYSSFDLSFVVTGLFGHKFLASGFNYPRTYGRGIPNSKLSDVFADGAPLRGLDVIELPYNDYDTYYSRWNKSSMDYMVRDAWNVRMQEVNLTYRLPKEIVSKLNLKGMMAYAQVNNLFTLKATKEDPVFKLGSTRLLPNYTFGVKINF